MTNEAFWMRSLPGELLTQFLTLAATPFEGAQHRPYWKAFGWPYTPSHLDDFGIRIELSNGSVVLIQSYGEAVGCYVAPVCYWSNYDRPELASYDDERDRYDAAYRRLYGQVHAALGEAQIIGTDPACSYAIWQASHALVIAQQTTFDVQFGIEVNLWLEQFTGPLISPSMPLISWLEARDNARSAKADKPAHSLGAC